MTDFSFTTTIPKSVLTPSVRFLFLYGADNYEGVAEITETTHDVKFTVSFTNETDLDDFIAWWNA